MEAKKLTWEEIKKRFNEEWVELIDYDWPEEEPDPRSGIVRVHAKTRKEFDRLTAIDPPRDAACVFVGELFPSDTITLGFSSVTLKPL